MLVFRGPCVSMPISGGALSADVCAAEPAARASLLTVLSLGQHAALHISSKCCRLVIKGPPHSAECSLRCALSCCGLAVHVARYDSVGTTAHGGEAR
eukprot:1663036-Pyramimonas_sp.AAC.1